MKQFIINIFILFFISIIVWLASNYSYQNKLNLLEAEKNNCRRQLTEKKQSALTLADVSFIIKKDKALASVKKSLFYFNVKTQKLTINQWRITVELKGEVESAADAADFKLDLPESLTVSDLKVGPAFPIYPRKVVAANYLLVTGLISTNNNQMIFGEPNKIFAEFTVLATDNQPNIKQIIVNREGTKIYLNGESILDTVKSVSLIDLR